MKFLPVIRRAAANPDVDEAIEHFLETDSEDAALGFVAALEAAVLHIASYPESGSPRYGHELNLPGLRFWPLSGFPHLVFYVTGEEHVAIWRVLHGRRDVPSWMSAEITSR